MNIKKLDRLISEALEILGEATVGPYRSLLIVGKPKTTSPVAHSVAQKPVRAPHYTTSDLGFTGAQISPERAAKWQGLGTIVQAMSVEDVKKILGEKG